MEQHVYCFRDILMGSDELSLLFWFVSNIYKLNIIKYKLLEKKKRAKSPALGFHFATTAQGECVTTALLVKQVSSAAKGQSWVRT